MKNTQKNVDRIDHLTRFIAQQKRSLAFAVKRFNQNQKDFSLMQKTILKRIVSDTKDIADAKSRLSLLK
jgi:hypothetical protein